MMNEPSDKEKLRQYPALLRLEADLRKQAEDKVAAHKARLETIRAKLQEMADCPGPSWDGHCIELLGEAITEANEALGVEEG